ncbi:MAG TPA: hypothetical protein VHI13_11500 [Candidatus Kapabacteria bacterium]|nr:hypothetical protein [Candidatus Kapabacteria bacterium]
MKRILLGGILGGVTLFAWSFLSWMILPLHDSSLRDFTNDSAVAQVLLANVPESGVYHLPAIRGRAGESHDAGMARMMKGQHMLAAVRLGDMSSGDFGTLYGLQLLFMILTGCMMAWLLTRTTGLGYLGAASFLAVVGAVVAVTADLPNWNWWGFSLPFTIAYVVDHIVGSFLAGLVMARFVRS